MSFLSIPLFIFAGLPQTFRLLRRKSGADISVPAYLATWLGVLFVLADSSGPVFYSNFISIVILTINISLILYYNAKNR